MYKYTLKLYTTNFDCELFATDGTPQTHKHTRTPSNIVQVSDSLVYNKSNQMKWNHFYRLHCIDIEREEERKKKEIEKTILRQIKMETIAKKHEEKN